MFGARWISPLKPLMKNFWLTTMTMMVSSISNIIRARWFSAKKAGSGQSHSIQHMIYIKGIQKITETISRRSIFGVSVSFSSSSCPDCTDVVFVPPFSDAPYPAFCTASMMAEADAVPSTPIELVSRLTEQEVTPGTSDTAFSTLALHAAQLMPVTSYCFIAFLPPITSSAAVRSSAAL